jgi:hypothetical protein
MTTELTRYNGYRYVMRKGQTFSDDAEKTKAGRAMLMHVDMYVWESNAALVARVESFLLEGFSWYSRSDKSARDTLQTLLAYVRDGAVDIFRKTARRQTYSRTAVSRLTRQRDRRDRTRRRSITTRGARKIVHRYSNTTQRLTRGSSANIGRDRHRSKT